MLKNFIYATLTILIIALALATSAHAESATVKLVFIKDPGWIGNSNSTRLTRDLIKYFKEEANIDLKISVARLSGFGNPEFLQDVQVLRDLSEQGRYSFHYDVVHYVLAPGTSPLGKPQIGGAAKVCTIANPYRNSGYSNGYIGSDAKLWYLRSLTAAAHEIGHQLGGTHLSNNSLMNTDVLHNLRDELLPISSKTKREINKCLASGPR